MHAGRPELPDVNRANVTARRRVGSRHIGLTRSFGFARGAVAMSMPGIIQAVAPGRLRDQAQRTGPWRCAHARSRAIVCTPRPRDANGVTETGWQRFAQCITVQFG